MLQTENKVDDDDDDYELPSLSERVQASLKSCNTLSCILSSDSESEETEFQKIFKGNNSTPHSEIKYKPIIFSSESEDDKSELLRSGKVHSTSYSKKRLAHLEKNYYEDLNGSYISKFQNRQMNNETDESDSDESFSNIIENIRKNQTPISQKKLKCPKGNELHKNKKRSYSLQRICSTPAPVSKIKKDNGLNESDDEPFSNIIKNIHRSQTPITQYNFRQTCLEENESDSDGEFSNVIEKLNTIHLPKSQNKNSRKIVSPISGKQEFSTSSAKEALLLKSSSVKAMNKNEYAALFPSKYAHLSPKDQAMYGQKLFKFFNDKIFSSQLPTDMPLIWSNSLMKAAGLTHCRLKNGIRSCSIKLSSKLLISFDRLQDTLLHEMCHAAVWMISEGHEHHGPLWKIWASRCKLILPFVECPEQCHNYDITYRVWYQCLNCDWRVGRCKQSQKLQRSVCKKCKTPLVMTTN